MSVEFAGVDQGGVQINNPTGFGVQLLPVLHPHGGHHTKAIWTQ